MRSLLRGHGWALWWRRGLIWIQLPFRVSGGAALSALFLCGLTYRVSIRKDYATVLMDCFDMIENIWLHCNIGTTKPQVDNLWYVKLGICVHFPSIAILNLLTIANQFCINVISRRRGCIVKPSMIFSLLSVKLKKCLRCRYSLCRGALSLKSKV